VSANFEPEHGCEWQLDAAAYVLHALEENEAHAFGEHLASCPGCREEVAQLQSVADALAAGVARASVPQGLGARIMAPVYAEAELLQAAGHEADRVAPARSRRRGLLPAFATAFALGVGLLIGTFAINTGSSERTEVIRAVVVSPGHRATADLREVGSHLQLVVEGMPAPTRCSRSPRVATDRSVSPAICGVSAMCSSPPSRSAAVSNRRALL
jgi:anti-sigma factor RsiW